MVRENKKKRTIVLSLIGLTLLMTVGYAAFQTNLEIKGTSKITSTWDVKITNVSVTSENGDGKNVTFSHTDTTASMEADLYEKGDSVEYDVLIENAGTIAASIKEITNSTKSTNEAVKITFSGFTKEEILQPKTSKTIHVKIEADPDYEGELPTGSTEITVTPEYVQPDPGEETPRNRYLVNYDCTTNGGKDCSSFNEYLNSGTTVNLTNIADSVGELTFIGWNTDKNAKTALSSLTMSEGNITLYAIFKDMQSPVIHFNPESQDDYTRKSPVTINLSDNGTGLTASQNVFYAWSKSDSTVPTTWSSLSTTNTAGQKEASVTVPDSASSNLTGTYYLWVKSGISDVYGNSADAKVSEAFHFDNTNPTLSLSTSSTTSDIIVVAEADAASGIEKYEFSIDGEDWIDNGEDNTFAFVGLSNDTEDGTMSISELVTNAMDNGDGLYADDFEEGRYVYKGAEVNNYVQFQDGSIWRIISIEPNGTLKIINTNKVNGSLNEFNKTADDYIDEFVPTDWQKLLTSSPTWNAGTIEDGATGNYSIYELIEAEKAEATHNQTIGTLSLTEFLRASSDASCSTFDDFRNYYDICSILDNWLGTMFSNSSIGDIWTSTPSETSTGTYWELNEYANPITDNKETEHDIYPVVNLSAGTYFNGGNGSEGSPYVLAGNNSHTIKARVTSGVGLTSTESTDEKLSVLEPPTFSESGSIPRTVIITYPEGCGSTLTCSYIKDNGSSVYVTSTTASVSFSKNGTLIATVSDGKNEVSSSYTASLDTTAPTVSFSPNSQSTYTKSTPVTVKLTDNLSGLNANQKVYYAWSKNSSSAPTFNDISLNLSESYNWDILNKGGENEYDVSGFKIDGDKLMMYYDYWCESSANEALYQTGSFEFTGSKFSFDYTIGASDYASAMYYRIYQGDTLKYSSDAYSATSTGSTTGTVTKTLDQGTYKVQIYFIGGWGNICDDSWISNIKINNTLQSLNTNSGVLTTSNSSGTNTTSVTVPASASEGLTGRYYLWIKSGISDTFGNTTTNRLSNSFYFDNTPPTCTTTGGTNKWVASTQTITGACSDSDSGCSSSNVSRTFSIDTAQSGSYNSYYSPGTITDKAGNSTTCPHARVRVTGITLDDYKSGAVFLFDGKTGLHSTIWYDQSGNNRNGTIVGATPMSSNYSVYFDGVNDYVRIAQLNYSAVTLESSFKFKTLPSSGVHIISNLETGGYALYKSTVDNKMGASTYKDGAYRLAYTSAPSIGTTYYGATRVNNEYIKSTLNETTTTTNYSAAITSPKNSTYMVLGGNPNGSTASTDLFNGYMYTARMYSSVLSDDQLQKHYVIDKARFGY